jgi:hypothetical protein
MSLILGQFRSFIAAAWWLLLVFLGKFWLLRSISVKLCYSGSCWLLWLTLVRYNHILLSVSVWLCLGQFGLVWLVLHGKKNCIAIWLHYCYRFRSVCFSNLALVRSLCCYCYSIVERYTKNK